MWKALLYLYEKRGSSPKWSELVPHLPNPRTNYWQVVARDLERLGYISRKNGRYTPLLNVNGEFVESEITFITQLIKKVADKPDATWAALILKTAYNSEEMLPVLSTQLTGNANVEEIESLFVVTYLLLLLRRSPKKIPKIKITQDLDENIIGEFTSWVETAFPKERGSDDK